MDHWFFFIFKFSGKNKDHALCCKAIQLLLSLPTSQDNTSGKVWAPGPLALFQVGCSCLALKPCQCKIVTDEIRERSLLRAQQFNYLKAYVLVHSHKMV